VGLTNKGRICLYDDFLGAALRGEYAGVTENSGTAAVVVGQEGGAATVLTGTSSGNRAHISAGLNWKAASGSIYFEARVKPITDITLRANFVGLTDTVAQENPIEYSTTTVTANATDAVGFMFDTAGTVAKWHAAWVKAGAASTLVAGVFTHDGVQPAPVAGEYENFGVHVNTDGDTVFSYGRDTGNKYGLREVLRVSDTVTPTVLLTPHVGIETRTTAAKEAYVDYIDCEGGRA